MGEVCRGGATLRRNSTSQDRAGCTYPIAVTVSLAYTSKKESTRLRGADCRDSQPARSLLVPLDDWSKREQQWASQ